VITDVSESAHGALLRGFEAEREDIRVRRERSALRVDEARDRAEARAARYTADRAEDRYNLDAAITSVGLASARAEVRRTNLDSRLSGIATLNESVRRESREAARSRIESLESALISANRQRDLRASRREASQQDELDRLSHAAQAGSLRHAGAMDRLDRSLDRSLRVYSAQTEAKVAELRAEGVVHQAKANAGVQKVQAIADTVRAGVGIVKEVVGLFSSNDQKESSPRSVISAARPGNSLGYRPGR
jgi:hypothetical protein